MGCAGLQILVIEGLHPFFDDRVADLLDFKIYLDISDDVKFAWKLQRDMAERGHSEESIRASIEARKPDFDAYIDPQKEKADVIIQVCRNCIAFSRWQHGSPPSAVPHVCAHHSPGTPEVLMFTSRELPFYKRKPTLEHTRALALPAAAHRAPDTSAQNTRGRSKFDTRPLARGSAMS